MLQCRAAPVDPSHVPSRRMRRKEHHHSWNIPSNTEFEGTAGKKPGMLLESRPHDVTFIRVRSAGDGRVVRGWRAASNIAEVL